jgi:hypothetical protein
MGQGKRTARKIVDPKGQKVTEKSCGVAITERKRARWAQRGRKARNTRDGASENRSHGTRSRRECCQKRKEA